MIFLALQRVLRRSNTGLWPQIDTVLCGECKESTSSSSSSEDECLEAEMGNTKSSESMPGEASNVVPMRSKLRADKGTINACLMLSVQRLHFSDHTDLMLPCKELHSMTISIPYCYARS